MRDAGVRVPGDDGVDGAWGLVRQSARQREDLLALNA